MKFNPACIIVGLAIGAASASQATTFASLGPSGTAGTVSLSGLSLSSAAPVVFSYNATRLAKLRPLAATLNLTATETGAISFGPIVLGSFDGSFAIDYTGATHRGGGVTLHTGDELLSGTFLGAVFDGYGSAGSIADSIVSGGLVTFNNNKFLGFSGIGDQGLSFGLSSFSNPVSVTNGKLSDFTAVATGGFSADNVSSPPLLRATPSAVPEPAAWGLMLLGLGGVGASVRARRRNKLGAPAS